MASGISRLFSTEEIIAILDNDDLERGNVDLDGESDDGEEIAGDFEGCDGLL